MAFGIQKQVYTGLADRAVVDEGLRQHMLRVYNYMASGLALTGIVAVVIAQISFVPTASGQLGLTEIGYTLFATPMKWVVMLAPLGLVFFLSARLHKLQFGTAQTVFWIFSALMGMSLAIVFMIYTGASIARVFFITAGTFGAMSLYGYTTKKDLTNWGSFLFMGLIGIIIDSVVNIFLASSALKYAISV
ncbi:MAG: Bax inhibitor-1/YccA family protein, partial [Alphaproteobacteria bacterium]